VKDFSLLPIPLAGKGRQVQDLIVVGQGKAGD